MHRVTSMDKSRLKTIVRGKNSAHNKYVRYKPIWEIGTDVVGKVRKVISYNDAL